MDDTCGSVEALQHKRSGKAACATDTMDEWNVSEKSATVRIRRLLRPVECLGAQCRWPVPGRQPRCTPSRSAQGSAPYVHAKPWRMGRLRSMLPRTSYPGTWPDEADVCRVTIVRPDACTFSGVPYIPPLTLAQHTAADEKESNITAPHPVFYEMWLSENFGDEKEAIKLGLFLCYDGVSGDLQQCFHMKELALLDAEKKIQDPAAEIDFETLSAAVASMEAESRKHLASSQAQQVLGGASVEGVVRKAELRGDVCVHHFVEGALGPEVCWQAQPVAARDFATPSRHQSHAYHHLVFDDGFYAHVPKHLGAFEGDISLEIGCLRMHTSGGGLQARRLG